MIDPILSFQGKPIYSSAKAGQIRCPCRDEAEERADLMVVTLECCAASQVIKIVKDSVNNPILTYYNM